MKNKIVTFILGIALTISVAGNICLVWLSSNAKGEATALSNQLVTADSQIADLQGQLADFAEVQAQVADLQEQLTYFTELQTQVADLQEQLLESQGLTESLESIIIEQNTTMADLEEQLTNKEQLLLEAQTQAQARKSGGNGSNGSSAESEPNTTKTAASSGGPNVGGMPAEWGGKFPENVTYKKVEGSGGYAVYDKNTGDGMYYVDPSGHWWPAVGNISSLGTTQAIAGEPAPDPNTDSPLCPNADM